MRKVVFLFAAALFCLAGTDVQAQKQIGGDKNFEFNFAPLGGNPIGINGIRFRYFNSENSAIRATIFVGGTRSEDPYADVDAVEFELGDQTYTNGERLNDIESTFDFTIRAGYEKHFDGTDRLSPYIGGEIDFGSGNMKTTQERFTLTGTQEGDNIVASSPVLWELTETTPYTRFGVNAVAGFDFYFADNIYLGAELGFGFSRTNTGDSEFEFDNDNAYFFGISGGQSITASNGDDAEFYAPGGDGNGVDVPTLNGTMQAWGPTVNGAIRLGILIN